MKWLNFNHFISWILNYLAGAFKFFNSALDENYPDDSILWRSLKSGDEKALQALFRKQYSPLYLYGVKITQNTALVEDSIQELFTEIWFSKAAGDIISVKAYLIRSLHYKIYKKLKESKLLLPGNDDFSALPFEITKENLMVQEEEDKMQALRIEKLLAQVSSRQRQIIYLKYYRNMSYEEISEIMQINYQASRNLLSQALKVLRKMALTMWGFI